jgi:hypothetical protein
MEERMEFLSADLWSAHDAVWPKPASVEEVARFDAEEEAWRAQTRQRLEEIKRAKTNAAPNSRTAGGSTSSPARPQSTLTNPP